MILSQQIFSQLLGSYANLDIHPCMGMELEFYVYGTKQHQQSFLDECNALGLKTCRESEVDQFEIQCIPHKNITHLIQEASDIKSKLSQIATKHTCRLTYDPKPQIDKAGSGIHIHLSLLDGNGTNLFSLNNGTLSSYLQQAIAGTLALMPQSTQYIFQTPQSINRILHPDIHTPTTVSWGVNNRSTAIRVIYTNMDPQNTRIEYRIAGSDACIPSLIQIVLISALYGINQHTNLQLPERAYGIARCSESTTYPPLLSDHISHDNSIIDTAMMLIKLTKRKKL